MRPQLRLARSNIIADSEGFKIVGFPIPLPETSLPDLRYWIRGRDVLKTPQAVLTNNSRPARFRCTTLNHARATSLEALRRPAQRPASVLSFRINGVPIYQEPPVTAHQKRALDESHATTRAIDL